MAGDLLRLHPDATMADGSADRDVESWAEKQLIAVPARMDSRFETARHRPRPFSGDLVVGSIDGALNGGRRDSRRGAVRNHFDIYRAATMKLNTR
jgi:hypothetical protein